MCACLNKAVRRKYAYVLLETESHTIAQIQREQVMSANKNQFIGYYCLFERVPEPKDLAMWEDAEKPGSGAPGKINKRGQQVYAIELPETSSKEDSAAKSVSFQKREEWDEVDDVAAIEEQAKKRLRSDTGPEMFSMFGGAMNPFNGTAMSTSEDFVGNKFKKASPRGVSAGDGGSTMGSVSSVASLEGSAMECDDEMPSSLTTARSAAKKKAKEVTTKLFRNKSATHNQMKKIIEKQGDDHEDVIAEKCEERLQHHADAISKLDVAVNDCGSWDGDMYRELYIENS